MDPGKCGVRTYHGFSQAKVTAALQALRDNGASVAGNNPWDVDTGRYGVKVHAEYDPNAELLTVAITDKAIWVPCAQIWGTIDPLLSHLVSLADSALA